MHQEEIKREKLIKFIKSNNPFYAFTSFDNHSTEQLEKTKKDIERVIKVASEKNKIKS